MVIQRTLRQPTWQTFQVDKSLQEFLSKGMFYRFLQNNQSQLLDSFDFAKISSITQAILESISHFAEFKLKIEMINL